MSEHWEHHTYTDRLSYTKGELLAMLGICGADSHEVDEYHIRIKDPYEDSYNLVKKWELVITRTTTEDRPALSEPSE